MAKLSKPARRQRRAMRKITHGGAARSAYKVARKTARSAARSTRKRAGSIVGNVATGNVQGLRDDAGGIARDTRRTAVKATKKAVRY